MLGDGLRLIVSSLRTGHAGSTGHEHGEGGRGQEPTASDLLGMSHWHQGPLQKIGDGK